MSTSTSHHPDGVSDEERLVEEVRERLDTYEPLRASGARIAVTVEQGVVHLRGHVRSATHPAEAARIVLPVPGVRAVDVSGLRTDEQTAIDVATALARDREIARASLRVRAALGLVVLRGVVDNEHIVERAIAVCRTVPGVERIRSEIVVRATHRTA